MDWRPEHSKILTKAEVKAVIEECSINASRLPSVHLSLVIFRLATGCGLRASEIAGITMSNVRVGIKKPHIYVPKTVGKGGKQRYVPLWWDRGTLRDIRDWKAYREQRGATPNDFFACALSVNHEGNQLHRNAIGRFFKNACKVLGDERKVSVHSGRHTFVSQMLNAGRSLAEVRDAAGHSSISTTSIYTHIAADDEGEVTEVYALSKVEA